MIIDVTLSQLRRLFVAGSNLLRYETKELIYLYYVNQSPAIFRTILDKPEDATEYQLLLTKIPQNMPVLKITLDSDINVELLKKINELLVEVRTLRSLEEENDKTN